MFNRIKIIICVKLSWDRLYKTKSYILVEEYEEQSFSLGCALLSMIKNPTQNKIHAYAI